jgi:hypothetical protein
MAPLLRLVTQNPDPSEYVRQLEKGGFRVNAGPCPTHQIGGHFRDLAPAAIVIDMDKLPSHGRAVAVIIRTTKSTRHFPIVFAGGEPEKIARAQSEMPDACFTDWKKAPAAIKKFIRNAPADPIRPPDYMDQFAGSNTVKKLGIKAGMRLAAIGEPDGFLESLDGWPEGVDSKSRIDRQTKLALWFVRSRSELESEITFMSARLPEGCSLWVIHPKQTGRYRSDFNQNHVRDVALVTGLVDYKVCSVDGDWSALKFARKKA